MSHHSYALVVYVIKVKHCDNHYVIISHFKVERKNHLSKKSQSLIKRSKKKKNYI